MPGALIGLAARSITASGVRGVTASLGNVCVSNVPGSQVPLYLCGARIAYSYGLGPGTPPGSVAHGGELPGIHPPVGHDLSGGRARHRPFCRRTPGVFRGARRRIGP